MGKAPRERITGGDIQDLAVAVEQLTEETRLLRMSLDELRDDVVWAARQVLTAGDAVAPQYGFCRPRDPLAPDAFASHESANRAEQVTYCCERPKLQWTGDPDAPGLVCASCRYIVVEMGDVVCWSESPEPTTTERAAEGEPPASSRQQNLWDEAEA